MLKYNNIDLVEVFALVLLAVGVVLIGIGWVEGTHASSELTRVLVETGCIAFDREQPTEVESELEGIARLASVAEILAPI